MRELKVEVDAAEVGLDPERLSRIDAHFARCGSRDLEAGLPVTDDTLWRIYSMTKPVTPVAAMILYEEGKLASPIR